jgi:hypothetical protein
MVLVIESQAIAASITVGAPAKAGVDTYSIIENTTFFPTTFTFSVVIPAGTSASSKTGLIAAAAAKAGVPVGDIILVGNTVNFIGYDSLSGVNGTAEFTRMALGTLIGDPAGPSYAALGYGSGSALSGIDSTGAAALYTTGFSFTDSTLGNVAISASVSAGSLAALTIPDLLDAEYLQLSTSLALQAPAFAGSLTLDLANRSIDFSFPSTVVDGSVTNGVTDTSLVSNETIVATPEPPGMALLGLGILVIVKLRACCAPSPPV